MNHNHGYSYSNDQGPSQGYGDGYLHDYGHDGSRPSHRSHRGSHSLRPSLSDSRSRSHQTPESWRGVFTALITPFYDGKVDYLSLEKLVGLQLESQSIRGFVIAGTTGESPTITSEEKKKIFQCVRSLVPKHFPLLVGTGSNSTEDTLRRSLEVQSWDGVSGFLVIVPYYNKPPQRGLLEHFRTLADGVDLPVFLYNVPGRTVTDLEVDTVAKLSQHVRIEGIKEATGKIDRVTALREKCQKDFILLSGDDGTYDEFLKVGGHGIISVASHVIPRAMAQADIAPYRSLINLLFAEANPIPVKMALYLMGSIRSPELRLPLVPLSPDLTETLKSHLRMDLKKL